jgi:CRP-like cAMP-binding protein
MKKSKQCDLKSCLFCRLCLPEWLAAVEVNKKNLQIKKGEVIFKEGETMTGIYFVFSGTVKVHKQWGKDKELILRFAKKGDIFGHRGLGKDTVYPISATALENCTVCFLPLDFFLSSLKVNQEFMYQLMLFFAEELKLSESKMRNLAHMPVKGRIAQALLYLHEKFGVSEEGHIDILLSRQDIASYAGTTYETVFRVISEFIENELVEVEGKKITIRNADGLKKLTSDAL